MAEPARVHTVAERCAGRLPADDLSMLIALEELFSVSLIGSCHQLVKPAARQGVSFCFEQRFDDGIGVRD